MSIGCGVGLVGHSYCVWLKNDAPRLPRKQVHCLDGKTSPLSPKNRAFSASEL